MLKIKDDVDLKELEKFGFDDFGVCYKGYGDFGSQFFINKGDRLIKRVHPYSLREEANQEEMHNLIQARISRKSRGVILNNEHIICWTRTCSRNMYRLYDGKRIIYRFVYVGSQGNNIRQDFGSKK